MKLMDPCKGFCLAPVFFHPSLLRCNDGLASLTGSFQSKFEGTRVSMGSRLASLCRFLRLACAHPAFASQRIPVPSSITDCKVLIEGDDESAQIVSVSWGAPWVRLTATMVPHAPRRRPHNLCTRALGPVSLLGLSSRQLAGALAP
jgi:hypothetical protein